MKMSWLKQGNQYYRTLLVAVASLTVVLVIFGGSSLFNSQGKLQIDPTIEPFISRDSDAYQDFLQTRSLFGNEEVLVVALQPVPPQSVGLAHLELLESLRKTLQSRLSGLKSIQSVFDIPRPVGACSGYSYFHQEQPGSICVSRLQRLQEELACLQNPTPPASTPSDLALSLEDDPLGASENPSNNLADSLLLDLDPTELPQFDEISSAVPSCPAKVWQKTAEELRQEADQDIKQILKELAENSLALGDFISAKATTLGMLLQFHTSSLPSSAKTQETLQKILKEFSSPELRLAYAGQPRQIYASSKALQGDIERILPLSLGLIIIVLFAIFRTPRVIIVAFVNVVLSLVWTASFVGLLGHRLNLVTIAFAPILICVGSAYVIMVLDRFLSISKNLPKESVDSRVSKTLDEVVIPVSVTAFTTVVGFAALIASPIPAIQQLGLYSCVGILLSNFFALTATPSLLKILRVAAPHTQSSHVRNSLRWFGEGSEWLQYRARKVIIFWLLLATIASLGILNLKIDSNSQALAPEHPLEQDLNLIESDLAGTQSLRLVFQAKPEAQEKLVSAATIVGLDNFEVWLLILKTEQWPDSLKGLRIDKIYSPAQMLWVYRNGLDDLNDLEVQHFFEKLAEQDGPVFLSPDGESLLVTLRLKADGSSELLELRERLQQKLPEFVPHLDVTFTGGAVLTSESANNIASGQINSVLLALFLIFGVMWGLFLSWKMGVIALFPNIAAVLLFFGTLGWFEIPLGVTISIIASIALGIGVDDTVHFLTRYHERVKQERDRRKAAQLALQQMTRPMLTTTLALGLGFSVFAFSELDSLQLFGLLTAYTLLICLATDLTFLPTIVMETGLVTVWDYVGLRINKQLVQRLAIFRGLSVREAKIATLLAYSEDLKNRQVLFKTGDQGQEMFVILSGKIRIQQNPTGGATLAELGEGATFGEMGLFRRAQRSATAIAVGETRLLVINRDSLYHLMQQRPRIATTLFLNLARQLRQAILRTSQRVLDQVSKTQQEEAPPTSQPRPLMLNIFQGMTTKEQESLRGFGVLRSLPQGEKIMNQGEQGKEVLILLQGQLKVQINKDKGYVVLALINPGNLVGETAWLEENLVRTADVVAGTDSLGLFYDRLALEKLCAQESRLAARFAFNLICLLADRLEAANEQLEHTTARAGV